MKKLPLKTNISAGKKRIYFDDDGNLKLGTSFPSGVTFGFEIPSEEDTYYGVSTLGGFVFNYELIPTILVFSSVDTEGLAVLNKETGEILSTNTDNIYPNESGMAGSTEEFAYNVLYNSVSGFSDIVHFDSQGNETNRIELASDELQWIASNEGNYLYTRTYGNDIVKVDVRTGNIEWRNSTITDPGFSVSKVGNYVYAVDSFFAPRNLVRLNESDGVVNAPTSLPAFVGNAPNFSEESYGLDRLFVYDYRSVNTYDYYLLDGEGNVIASRPGASGNVGTAWVDSTGVYVIGDGFAHRLNPADLTVDWTYSSPDINGLQYVFANDTDVMYIGGNGPDVHAISKTDGSQVWFQDGLSQAPYGWVQDIFGIAIPPV